MAKISKDQQVEWGTWWDQPGDPPAEVLAARRLHGMGPNGEYTAKEDAWPGSSSSSSETSSETTPKSTGSDESSPSTALSTGGRSIRGRRASSTAHSVDT